MMFLRLLISITVPLSYGQIRESEYECGAHGKFEYCIDGIPGCVVGCHCHPGYYFDTDTKICEPNIRLTQNYRRNYDVSEPKRIYLLPTLPAVEEPATTVKSAVDEKIDLITKDADDLGDWLYNQFFKTIENQVINETKDEAIITRRSDSAPTFLKKPTRRSHKYLRAKKKRKKKRKGLKGKLLRITEDDSLFDSSSSSSSEDSSDSSSSSSSESSSEYGKEKRIKSDHGHKKIVVYNKRPKPPLPSFIFLPNMETPFFPPIGLPPPPIPMYPMVPVPPVMGPYPFPVAQTPCPDAVGTTTSASTSSAPEPTSTASTREQTTVSDTTTALSTTTTDKSDQEEKPTDDNIESKDEKTEEGHEIKLRNRKKPRQGPRNKLMKKLRKFERINKVQNIANEYPELEPPMEVNVPLDYSNNPIPDGYKTLSETKIREALPGLQDVDFKYLSQLIHRSNLNKTIQRPPPLQPPLPPPLPPQLLPPMQSPTKQMQNVLTPSPPNRRNYYDSSPGEIAQLLNTLPSQPVNQIAYQPTYQKYSQATHNLPYRKKIEDTNDYYYANLGRQIASMIRNMEGDKDVDIEISGSNYPINPVLNGNSESQSYWERSIRSPFKYMNSFKNEMNNLKKSNENLFSLENKVEIAVSTVPPLSLHQLENILSKVERAKSKLIMKNEIFDHRTDPSKTSFNVNLLPRNYKGFPPKRIIEEKSQNIPTQQRAYNKNKVNTRRQNTGSLLQPDPKRSLLTDFVHTLRKTFEKKNETALPQKMTPIVLPTRKSKNIGTLRYKLSRNFYSPYVYTVLPLPWKPPIHNDIKSPSLQSTTAKNYNRLSIRERNDKNVYHYFTGNRDENLFQKAAPLSFLPIFSNVLKPMDTKRPKNPSYFHQKTYRFDYFDDFL